nr:lactosylceramide 4-alpha-galactosyltransferase-like [Dermacentor andersoni]
MRADFFVVLLCLGIFTLVLDLVLEELPRYLHAMVRSDQRRKVPVFAAELDGSIFFAGAWTQKCLDIGEACAVESAARHHPGMWVVLFLDGPDRDGGHGRTDGGGAGVAADQCRTLEALLDMNNVHVRRLSLDELFARTPLKKKNFSVVLRRHWRAQDPAAEGRLERLSDAVRFALLWKYGGAYADLDAIVRKPLTKLRNCVIERGPEGRDPPVVSGSLLVFERGHPLMELCMEEMARQYHDSRHLVHSVSDAVVRTLRDHYVCERHGSVEFAPARELRCADGRSRVTVLPREAFFDATPHGAAAAANVRHPNATARSYVVNVRRHSSLAAASDRASVGSALEARRNCPRIDRLAQKNALVP